MKKHPFFSHTLLVVNRAGEHKYTSFIQDVGFLARAGS